MKKIFAMAALLATLCFIGSGGAPAAQAQKALPSATSLIPSGGHDLTKTDADAWLDGYMPNALANGDIAGAVVVIVKDGQVVTERGYGYSDVANHKPVDPVNTMFRMGSTSKLFTWISVMQLVEAGKLNLDADVNTYLDFKIPPYKGQPLTLREIMVHRSGFEEAIKAGIVPGGQPVALRTAVMTLLPKRVFAPGTTPSYSNYATALAGYIVQRVSGEPYEAYIERHIFQPLNMTESTFRQPVPARLAPLLTKGYDVVTGEAKPFETISVPPAGSLTMSGGDIAKFMNATLDLNSGLLKPETLRFMQTPAGDGLPGLNRMGLGFYEQKINDLLAVGHGGDLLYAHGYIWIIPQAHVGIAIEMNSAGLGEAPAIVRETLLERFGDRYFPPANANPPVELPTAKEHAQMLAGDYLNQRTWLSNFLDVSNLLGQTKITVGDDGRPVVPELFGGPARKWIEVAPFEWQDAYGHGRLGAKVENGKVVRWSINSVSPFMVWDRVPWYRDANWLIPLVAVAVGVMGITVLSWPIAAIVRRRYGQKISLSGQELTLYRLGRGLAILLLATLAGWAALLSDSDGLGHGTVDGLIWTLEILTTLVGFGLAGTASWNLWRVFTTNRSWYARATGAIYFIASLSVLYVALIYHLISFGTKY